MVEEYKVRSGFKCNPWAIKKLSGLQLCAFICLCHTDPSAATISASHCWLLIQMYSPCLLMPGCWCSQRHSSAYVFTCFYELKQAIMPTQSSWFAAPDSHTSKAATERWVSKLGQWTTFGWVEKWGAKAKPFLFLHFFYYYIFTVGDDEKPGNEISFPAVMRVRVMLWLQRSHCTTLCVESAKPWTCVITK